MSKESFWFLSQTYAKYFEWQNTQLRRAIPAAKKIAIVLHWLAHASLACFPSFSQLATKYTLGKSTNFSVVHQGTDIHRKRLTPNAILFPTASELRQIMVDFEALCGLPWCHVHAYKVAWGVQRYLLLLQEVLCITGVGTCGCQFFHIIMLINARRPGSVICIPPQPFVCKDPSLRMACTCFHSNWRSTCEVISCSWFSISPGLHLQVL